MSRCTKEEQPTVYKTIVVGVDGRQGGRDALTLASRLATTGGAEIVAVNAYPRDYFITRGAEDHYEAMLRDGAQDTLARELAASGVTARTVVIADESPARALHRAARDESGDLIVVGSAHRGPLGRVLAGDVTVAALHGAACPVLVAPAGYQPDALKTIGVGFDGSFESHAAVRAARELAEAHGAHLRIIDVVAPVVPGGPYPVYRPDWDQIVRQHREEGQRLVDDIVSELGDLATGEVTVGDAADELAYEGNDLDLLVVGSRGYGPIKRLMLGSTSAKLVHRAPCPLLVVPRAAEHELEATDDTAAAAATR